MTDEEILRECCEPCGECESECLKPRFVVAKARACIEKAVAEEREKRPKVICLCGSTRFIELFAIMTWELERAEGAIVLGCTLLPMWYCNVADHFGEATGTKEECDNHHLKKIDLADEVMVLDVGGYVGESTAREIEYARKTGKPIRYWRDEPKWEAAIRARKESEG